MALAGIAKRYTSYWVYCNVIRTTFAPDGLSHTFYALAEGWLLRVIHHAMMFKKQLDIVRADCNGMVMDLYQTIPKIKEEQSLAEAVALSNVCKMDQSKAQEYETYQRYVGLQRKIICRLKMRRAEHHNKQRRYSLDGGGDFFDKMEPTSFEEAARRGLEPPNINTFGGLHDDGEDDNNDDLQIRPSRKSKKTSSSSSSKKKKPYKRRPSFESDSVVSGHNINDDDHGGHTDQEKVQQDDDNDNDNDDDVSEIPDHNTKQKRKQPSLSQLIAKSERQATEQDEISAIAAKHGLKGQKKQPTKPLPSNQQNEEKLGDGDQPLRTRTSRRSSNTRIQTDGEIPPSPPSSTPNSASPTAKKSMDSPSKKSPQRTLSDRQLKAAQKRRMEKLHQSNASLSASFASLSSPRRTSSDRQMRPGAAMRRAEQLQQSNSSFNRSTADIPSSPRRTSSDRQMRANASFNGSMKSITSSPRRMSSDRQMKGGIATRRSEQSQASNRSLNSSSNSFHLDGMDTGSPRQTKSDVPFEKTTIEPSSSSSPSSPPPSPPNKGLKGGTNKLGNRTASPYRTHSERVMSGERTHSVRSLSPRRGLSERRMLLSPRATDRRPSLGRNFSSNSGSTERRLSLGKGVSEESTGSRGIERHAALPNATSRRPLTSQSTTTTTPAVTTTSQNASRRGLVGSSGSSNHSSRLPATSPALAVRKATVPSPRLGYKTSIPPPVWSSSSPSPSSMTERKQQQPQHHQQQTAISRPEGSSPAVARGKIKSADAIGDEKEDDEVEDDPSKDYFDEFGRRRSSASGSIVRRISIVEDRSGSMGVSTVSSRPGLAASKRPSFKRPTLSKSRSQRLRIRQKAVDRLELSRRKLSARDNSEQLDGLSGHSFQGSDHSQKESMHQ